MDVSLPLSDDPTRRPAADAAPSPHVALDEGAEILGAIRRPAINLAVWTRALTRPIAQFARTCLVEPELHLGFEARTRDVAPALASAMDMPSGGPGQSWI